VSELHPATRGFAADVYERGRPGYAAAAIEHLVEVLDLRAGRTVLDLAAGTGKLARLLLPSGAKVIAVEPLPEMRAELERRVPGVTALAGTAESMFNGRSRRSSSRYEARHRIERVPTGAPC
jgi:predicted RNA methylase